MFDKLDLFRLAGAAAAHAGRQQAIVARNVANADTPGYRAESIMRFEDTLGRADRAALRREGLGHVWHTARRSDRPGAGGSDPNGNGVNLEDQMLAAVEINRTHDRALAIYRSSLSILHASLGRR